MFQYEHNTDSGIGIIINDTVTPPKDKEVLRFLERRGGRFGYPQLLDSWELSFIPRLGKVATRKVQWRKN